MWGKYSDRNRCKQKPLNEWLSTVQVKISLLFVCVCLCVAIRFNYVRVKHAWNNSLERIDMVFRYGRPTQWQNISFVFAFVSHAIIRWGGLMALVFQTATDNRKYFRTQMLIIYKLKHVAGNNNKNKKELLKFVTKNRHSTSFASQEKSKNMNEKLITFFDVVSHDAILYIVRIHRESTITRRWSFCCQIKVVNGNSKPFEIIILSWRLQTNAIESTSRANYWL